MNKVKFAVVGCGNIGRRHIAVVDAEPNAELVAISDIDESICEEQSQLYNNVSWYNDYHQLLVNTDCDFVNICTPHYLHKEMTLTAIAEGKNVLVEKPMALSVEDCEEMNKAAKEAGVKLYVVKQNRFNTPVRLLKQLLDSGKLGQVYMVKCDVLWNRYQGYYDESPWRGKKALEGGALFTQVSHFIDLLVWWFGDVIDAKTHLSTKSHEIEIEDCGNASIVFDSGTMGAITWTTSVYSKNYEGSITIVGENGTIKIGGKYLNKIEYWDVQAWPLDTTIEYTDKPNLYGKYQGTSSNHPFVIEHIIQNFNQDTGDVVEGTEGIKSIKAIEMIYNNAKLY
ncbi:Gfo/Idh/MocA family oxidoreductase [uncultured Microscilla sp.]|uniref:Gfo/Idh/MocA family protein n=1 Tax=uncultured Microscilla sp. TaxID=432653 RepID=UPI0026049991|nr:Gfo/Idh/MocA family oxidoreductase [uncultured Microscilla sp.]